MSEAATLFSGEIAPLYWLEDAAIGEFLILLSPLFGVVGYRACRIAYINTVSRDIFGDHRSGSDYRARTNGYSGKQYRSTTDPTIIADGDRFADFDRTAFPIIQRMMKGINLDCRSDQNMVANSDRCSVQHDAIVIDETAFTDIQIVSVVTEKGRADHTLC